ncbi:MAG: hypothetical protein ACREOF_15290 [Gemmatimonadales bacterium]
MFIELTDHLRCPRDHDEAYLVLLPDEIVGRAVRSGQLGCPVCGMTFPVTDGAAELGDGPAASAPALPAHAMHAFLGLTGPGGYVVLAGSAADGWRALSELNPGVALVAVNPTPEIADAAPVLSVVRAPILPLKARSMRGVVLGGTLGSDPHWVADAARVTLPGLRVVGWGPEPDVPGLDLVASADGCWVAARR